MSTLKVKVIYRVITRLKINQIHTHTSWPKGLAIFKKLSLTRKTQTFSSLLHLLYFTTSLFPLLFLHFLLALVLQLFSCLLFSFLFSSLFYFSIAVVYFSIFLLFLKSFQSLFCSILTFPLIAMTNQFSGLFFRFLFHLYCSLSVPFQHFL